jgi:outer membrane protein assembly factor BamA
MLILPRLKALYLSQFRFAWFVVIALTLFATSPAHGATHRNATDPAEYSLIVIPVGAYSPETGVIGGAGFFRFDNPSLDKPDQPADSYTALLMYTQKKQAVSSFSADKYLDSGRYRLNPELILSLYPDKFYGIGPDTPGTFEEYTSRDVTLKSGFLFKLNDGFYLGPYYHFSRIELEDLQTGGALESGTIPGSKGFTASGLGMQIIRDRRDNQLVPERGTYLELRPVIFNAAFGSSDNFALMTEDFRIYFPVSEGQVIAFQQFLALSDGSVPFQFLPQLGGGNKLRGMYEGRYRDQNSLFFQGEYRFPIYQRFRGVVFVGMGQVAESPGDFGWDKFKTAAGCGIRYTLAQAQKLNLRLDFGYSQDELKVYFRFGEAF